MIDTDLREMIDHTPEQLPTYSIIVPVYNGSDALACCLSRLTQQEYPAECYEVIVVDDGSTDDTAAIASGFPIRLIQLQTNQGRMVARNTGAEAALHDNLVFVDSRVEFPQTGLRLLSEVEYLPQLFWVYTRGEGWGWFNRILSLIRRRYYWPQIPLTPEEASRRQPFYLTPDNFDRAAKGTTSFACQRDLWLEGQPEDQSKYASDDTSVLRNIVERKPILKRYDLYVTYTQRERLGHALRHLFQRGPLFGAYYLRPGGKYHSLWIGLLVAGILVFPWLIVLGFLIGWVHTLYIAGGFVFLSLLGAGLYLAQRPSDVLLAMVMLPLVVGSFGAGILWGALVVGQTTQQPSA
jgi:glycosyltransferase involved in cell wall biosynthesis